MPIMPRQAPLGARDDHLAECIEGGDLSGCNRRNVSIQFDRRRRSPRPDVARIALWADRSACQFRSAAWYVCYRQDRRRNQFEAVKTHERKRETTPSPINLHLIAARS